MPSRITFRELAAERMASKRLRLAPRSYKTDEERLQKLLAVFAERRAISIKPAEIDRFLADLVVDGKRSTSTANRYHALLSSIFAHGIRAGHFAANPAKTCFYLKENPGRVRFLSDEEETALRHAIRELHPEREAEFDLALHTGMRRGEQFQLRRSGVDLARGVLTVQGKTGQRHIPINSAARAALETLLARSDGEFVCPETRHVGQRDWRRWYEISVRRAGLKNLRWHDLRHTFASRLVMAGVPARSVQEMLGHRSAAMTARYAHLSLDSLKGAAERLVIDPGAGKPW